jgi:hypothetical protein
VFLHRYSAEAPGPPAREITDGVVFDDAADERERRRVEASARLQTEKQCGETWLEWVHSVRDNHTLAPEVSQNNTTRSRAIDSLPYKWTIAVAVSPVFAPSGLDGNSASSSLTSQCW